MGSDKDCESHHHGSEEINEATKLLRGAELTWSAALREYIKLFAAILALVYVDVSLNVFLPTKVPPSLAGMFAIFIMLTALSAAGHERLANAVINAFKTAIEFISRFMTLFFVPSCVVLPNVVSTSNFGADVFAKLGLVTVLGIPFSLYLTAMIISTARKVASVSTLPVEPMPNVSPCTTFHARVIGITAIVSFTGIVMFPVGQNYRAATTVFLVAATASGMLVGQLPPSVQMMIPHPAFLCTANGIVGCKLVSMITGTSFMAVQDIYLTNASTVAEMGAGDILLMFLGPVLLTFGFHMYTERGHLFRHWFELLVGALVTSLASLVATTGAGRLLGLSPELSLAIAPRSVTLSLAFPMSEYLGVADDLLPMTGVIVTLTGMLGGAIFLPLLKVAGITDPVVRGFSTGSAAMGMGSAILARDEFVSLPYSALAMALVGIAGSVWVEVVPGVRPMLQAIAGM